MKVQYFDGVGLKDKKYAEVVCIVEKDAEVV